MNATQKAEQLQHRYEADGWAFGITWRPALNCYRVNYGQTPDSTAYETTAYVYLHPNGNVGHVEFHTSNAALAAYTDWPVNGAYAGNIETFLRRVLFAYAAAWPGSKAARENYLSGLRVVQA